MLQGQVVLITGAARGIGRYIAHTFAKAGARLAVNDIEPLDRVTNELRDTGVEVLPVTADVRDEEQVRMMMRRVLDHFGQIDVLINNAGIVPHFSWGVPRWPRIRDMDKSFWDQVIETNLGGTFLCTKHVLPYMEARRSGHIVNVYGGADVKSTACAYMVSKDAIRTFTRFVAEEERERNICVVIFDPGAAIATEEAPEEARRRLPGPEILGDAYVQAAQAGMELSGRLLSWKDGRLVVVS